MAVNPYDLQRQRIAKQTQATGAQENEALKRRMARMGGLNSGAYLKASERLAGQQEERQQAAMEGVDIQEATAAEQKAEAERGRQFSREERIGSQEFSRGERLGSQDFAAIEALKGREFAKGERLGAQDFAALEAEKGRKFTTAEREQMQRYATGERESSQRFASKERGEAQDWQRLLQGEQQRFASKERGESQDFAAGQSKLARDLQESQFVKQMDLAWKQFGLDEEVSKFNMDMANKIFNKRDFFEQIMDPLGGSKGKYGFGGRGNTMDPIGITGGALGGG